MLPQDETMCDRLRSPINRSRIHGAGGDWHTSEPRATRATAARSASGSGAGHARERRGGTRFTYRNARAYRACRRMHPMHEEQMRTQPMGAHLLLASTMLLVPVAVLGGIGRRVTRLSRAVALGGAGLAQAAHDRLAQGWDATLVHGGHVLEGIRAPAART